MNIHFVYRLIFRFTRKRRMRRFQHVMQPTDAMRVVDVGGTPFNWQFLAVKPHVLLLNTEAGDKERLESEQFTFEQGDGRQLPYGDRQFHIACSNSVIEHVGTHDDQRRFANEVRRVGRQVWVQTPARVFPIEPHFMAPIVHWFPKRWRYRLVRWLSLWCWLDRRSLEQSAAMVDEIRLLSHREMQELFPDCQIITERFLLWPKSYIAVRTSERLCNRE